MSQAEVVENKRLGAALALIKAQQDASRPAPRVKSASEAGGYVRNGRKSARRSWLLPETARTAPAMVAPLAPGLKAAASGGPLRGLGLDPGVQRRGRLLVPFDEPVRRASAERGAHHGGPDVFVQFSQRDLDRTDTIQP